jgi:hypothetical protein
MARFRPLSSPVPEIASRNVKFRESVVPRTGDTQIFLHDPDGVGVELNFPSA